MDLLALSRLQFALTAMFHFIFVPLTIGLVLLVAIMETLYVKTNEEVYKKMTQFFGKLFLINFALGVVTGITMEFQFGTNWSNYSKYVGDIFGAPLAIEATLAFFLESTFIGVWIFGWKRLSKKMHLFSIWMVALGTHLSAVWILVANGWMQHPVGYVLRNGRAELNDFGALISNSYAWLMYFHTLLAAYCVASFFVMGVSAFHLLRKNYVQLFKKSFSIGIVVGLIATIGVAILGDLNAKNIAQVQPTKFAAFESIWQTQANAPFHLIVIPDQQNQRNAVEAIAIPGLLSWLTTGDSQAVVKGMNDFPADQRPPVAIPFYSFRIMVLLGLYMIVMAITGLVLQRKGKLENANKYLKWMVYTIPVPYVSTLLGWVVAEVGRQPWIVYGLMPTAKAVSPIALSQIWFSILGLSLFYLILMIAEFYLMFKYARRGPSDDAPVVTPRSKINPNVMLQEKHS